jgi:hypothetical protein
MDGALGSLEARAKELADRGGAAGGAADPEQARLLADLQAELAKLKAASAAADPRLSFSTAEFRSAAAQFSSGFRDNFGRPREYALVKDHPWSTPALRKVGDNDEGGKQQEGQEEAKGGR